MTESPAPPLLSICIPTYNRAEWLRSSLNTLLPQAAASGGAVEIVVSDNCSPDHTRDVVDAASALGTVRYHRMPENVGPVGNMHYLQEELAAGEYVWLIGDDDLVRPDGVAQILQRLRDHPECDYFFVNYTQWHPPHDDAVLESPADYPDFEPAACSNFMDFGVAQVAELATVDPNCFTPIYCSIVRRSLLRGMFDPTLTSKLFETLEATVPQALFIIEKLFARPGWYIGTPCLIASVTITWKRFVPIYVLHWMHQVLDLCLQHGADPAAIGSHRSNLLGGSGVHFLTMVGDPDTPGRSLFSPLRFMLRFGCTKAFARSLWQAYVPTVWMAMPPGLRQRIKLLVLFRRTSQK